jgi:hypothetical protein
MRVNQELVQAIAREVMAHIEERYGAPSSGAVVDGHRDVSGLRAQPTSRRQAWLPISRINWPRKTLYPGARMRRYIVPSGQACARAIAEFPL